MSKISGVNQSAALGSIGSLSSAKPSAAKTTAQPTDTVEISPEARLASKIAAIPPVRSDLVARVRAEIKAGTYETEDKLNTAVDRMINE